MLIVVVAVDGVAVVAFRNISFYFISDSIPKQDSEVAANLLVVSRIS